VGLYADVQACYWLGQVWPSKIKSKRRNEGTQALREEAPKSGAGGQNRTGYARLFRAALYQ
jgi:hypothetical protein